MSAPRPALLRAGIVLVVLAALLAGALAVSRGRPARRVAAPAATPVINELSVNTAGTDLEYLEVLAPPGMDGTRWTLLALEGDANAGPGAVDAAIAVGALGPDGRFLARLPANTLENGTLTLLLVDGFRGAHGDDLDADDDGALDAAPWAALLDGVSISDGDDGDRAYAQPTLAAGFDGVRAVPGGASRIPDGVDTGDVGDWRRNDFDRFGIDGEAGTPAAGEAINTPGAANAAVEAAPGAACAAPPRVMRISAIQGSGPSAACTGAVVVEAVVVADFEGPPPALGGFYVQEDDADRDADPATSEGLFVANGGRDDVAVGDRVRVVGSVREVRRQTEVRADDVAVVGQGTVAPAVLALPPPEGRAPGVALEAIEGMRVVVPGALVVTDNRLLGRYGQVTLAAGARLQQPTDVVAPGAAAAALQAANDRRRLILDDGRLDEHADAIAFGLAGRPFDADAPLRAGDVVEGLVGVMTESPAVPNGGGLAYRLRAVAADFRPTNPRPAGPPDLGDGLRVAGFNVRNHFLTLDDGSARCGPLGRRQPCRGAATEAERRRQRAKLLAALAELDADIVGLVELENSAGVEPLADLVDGLAALGAGRYAYVDTGPIGTDVIRVGLLYRPARVAPLGPPALLTAAVDPRFDDGRNRPVLAQTFVSSVAGTVTVAVNHLKSKGSACPCDPDAGDGQGHCNGTRARATAALVGWLAGDPTGAGAGRYLVLGDLNAYAMEDPLAVLRAAGYVDLVAGDDPAAGYTYAFDGQWGRLDHALASPALAPDVVGAAPWHIDADEPALLGALADGRTERALAAWHRPDAFRASDHDPLLVVLRRSAATDGRPPTDLRRAWDALVPRVEPHAVGRTAMARAGASAVR